MIGKEKAGTKEPEEHNRKQRFFGHVGTGVHGGQVGKGGRIGKGVDQIQFDHVENPSYPQQLRDLAKAMKKN
jgi:hypothetical protein